MNCAWTTDKHGYAQVFNTWFNALIHRLAFDCLHKDMQIIVEATVLAAQVNNRAAGVHYRGVVAPAESFTNFRQAVRRKFPRQPHGYLAGSGDRASAFLGVHVGDFYFIEVGNSFLHDFKGDLPICGTNYVA